MKHLLDPQNAPSTLTFVAEFDDYTDARVVIYRLTTAPDPTSTDTKKE